MKRTRLLLLLLVLLLVLVLTNPAFAMSSANFRLDWLTPGTSGGGGVTAGSTNYAVTLTVGQTAMVSTTSASYSTGLGYWHGLLGPSRLHMPLILR